MRTLYDSTTAADIPTSATMVAGYDNGLYTWSQADWDRFPNAVHVHITVWADPNTGQVLDVENGDATPGQAPGWIRARMAAGVTRPTIYCNRDTFPAVQTACQAAPPGLNWAWWAADWTGQAHPLPSASAVQYADPPYTGAHYDLTAVYDDGWFPSPVAAAAAPTSPPQTFWQWWRQHHPWGWRR